MELLSSALGSVGFNWHVALANFVNFLIILFILNKFVFGSIRKMIDERNSIIRDGLSNAEEAEKKLRDADKEKEEILFSARKEGEGLVANATEKAKATADMIVEKSEAEATRLRTQLESQIKNAKSEVENEFAKYAPALVADMLKSTLQKNMTAEDNAAFIARLTKTN